MIKACCSKIRNGKPFLQLKTTISLLLELKLVAASTQLLKISFVAYPSQLAGLPLSKPLSLHGLSSAFTALPNVVLPVLFVIELRSTWVFGELNLVVFAISVSFLLLLLFLFFLISLLLLLLFFLPFLLYLFLLLLLLYPDESG